MPGNWAFRLFAGMQKANTMIMDKIFNYVLLDLDGTITDPMLGITRCVEYALNHFGIQVDDLRELCGFIGPPLLDSFRKFYGFSEQQALEAITIYRERFSCIGLYENKVYPGIEAMLGALKQTGKKLMVATSKPEIFARQILEYFHLDHYFSFIGGATLDGLRSQKDEVIRYVLEENRIKEVQQVVMVGDRKFDIEGAHKAGLSAIGVLYGYGSRKELVEAKAEYIVENVVQLRQLLSGK